MKKNKLRTGLCLLLAGFVLTAFVAIAVDVGSQGDPLVTLSYLNDTFLGQMLERVDEKLAGREEALQQELEEQISRTQKELLAQLGGNGADENGGAAVYFMEVNLTAGQTLWGFAGCEVMLRGGSASCVVTDGSVPGLLDTTDGSTANHGAALAANHLYMMPAQRGILASEDVTLLVRGEFLIG